jgi:arginase
MRISLLGAPMDLGADRRGVDMGPSAIRYAGLHEKLRALGHEVTDAGNIVIPQPETREPGDPTLKYLDQIVACAEELAPRVESCASTGCLPITLGGDHSIALGSVSGVVAAGPGPIGLLWLDAHADFNTANTSPSGNIHGMVLAALCGFGDLRLVNAMSPGPHLDPARVVIVGARDLDAGEVRLLREADIRVLTMTDIDRRGIAAVIEEALALATAGAQGLYVSFDLDVVDPRDAPGVGTPVPGGLTYREAHLAMELVAETDKLRGLDLVEVNPILDVANRTGLLAAELALSATGKRTV